MATATTKMTATATTKMTATATTKIKTTNRIRIKQNFSNLIFFYKIQVIELNYV